MTTIESVWIENKYLFWSILFYFLLNYLHLILLYFFFHIIIVFLCEVMQIEPFFFFRSQLCAGLFDIHYHFSLFADIVSLFNRFYLEFMIQIFYFVSGSLDLLCKQFVNNFFFIELRFESFKNLSFWFLYLCFKDRVLLWIFKHVVQRILKSLQRFMCFIFQFIVLFFCEIFFVLLKFFELIKKSS